MKFYEMLQDKNWSPPDHGSCKPYWERYLPEHLEEIKDQIEEGLDLPTFFSAMDVVFNTLQMYGMPDDIGTILNPIGTKL